MVMAYLTSLLVAAGAVVVLTVLLLRLVGPARRTARGAQTARAALTEGAGLLAARVAALRHELDRRRGTRSGA